MTECDFLVIGAGMAGASAAYELAGHGRVILLEREAQAGYHSTGRSAAVYAESYGNTTVRALTSAGRTFFESPPPGFAEAPVLSPRGFLFIARTDQEGSLQALIGDAHKTASPLRLVTAAEALGRVPVLDSHYVAAAAVEPGAMDMDVHAIHQGFLKGVRARGGRLITNAEVVELGRANGRWCARTRTDRFAAPVVVNAAGAWADEAARLAGVRPVGLVPKRRTAFVFDPPEGLEVADWPVVIDVDEEFYFKPEAGRILGSPADETPVPAQDVQPEELDVAIGADRIERATTLTILRIERKWAGLRSFVSDKTPVVGFAPDAPGFFWLAGQGGYGIQTAPGLARIAAALATGRPLPGDLAERGVTEKDLAPERLWDKRPSKWLKRRASPRSDTSKAGPSAPK